MRWRRLWPAAVALAARASHRLRAPSALDRAGQGAGTSDQASDARGPAGAASDREIGARFSAERTRAGDLTCAQLVARLDLARAPVARKL